MGMNKRVSREDACYMLERIQKQSERDKNTNCHLYGKCESGQTMRSEATAPSSELLCDIIGGLSAKIDFFQHFLVEQVLVKCVFLVTQFMKEYGKVMEAAVNEILSTVKFFKTGLQNMLTAAVDLTSEKDLYADKALSLAKGFVTTTNHTLDMITIQPSFSFLDVVSDICFKSNCDVHNVICEMYRVHSKVKHNELIGSSSLGNNRASANPPISKDLIHSTTHNIGYLKYIYNQQLLQSISTEVHSAVTLVKESGDDIIDERLEHDDFNDDENVIPMRCHNANRNKCALQIQRFIHRNWTFKRRVKIRKKFIVRSFLSRIVFNMRAREHTLTRRRIIFSKALICRAIIKYLSYRKLKAVSRSIIRSNMRKLFRNHLFRDVAAACRFGAKLLIQREWALKYSDIELRLMRIEAFLSSGKIEPSVPYEIHQRSEVPLPKNEKYLSAHVNKLGADYSREGSLNVNVHIMKLHQLDDEQKQSISDMSKTMDVFDSICLAREMESLSSMRMARSSELDNDVLLAADSTPTQCVKSSRRSSKRYKKTRKPLNTKKDVNTDEFSLNISSSDREASDINLPRKASLPTASSMDIHKNVANDMLKESSIQEHIDFIREKLQKEHRC